MIRVNHTQLRNLYEGVDNDAFEVEDVQKLNETQTLFTIYDSFALEGGQFIATGTGINTRLLCCGQTFYVNTENNHLSQLISLWPTLERPLPLEMEF